MIDFQNGIFSQLSREDGAFDSLIAPILTDGESVISTYKALRDGVVFTSKRLITINIQGMTGKKKDVTSLPYSKIQAFSVETAGVLDIGSELELWYSGLGKVKLGFVCNANIVEICRLISDFVL